MVSFVTELMQTVLLGGALTDGDSIVDFLVRKLLNMESDEAFLSCLEDAAMTYTNNIGNNEVKDHLSVHKFIKGEYDY